jgi:hypothetical protein
MAVHEEDAWGAAATVTLLLLQWLEIESGAIPAVSYFSHSIKWGHKAEIMPVAEDNRGYVLEESPSGRTA